MSDEPDDTELTRLRGELELLRYRFDLLVEHSGEAIYLKDLLGRYVYVNQAAASMMYRRPEELIGTTDDGVFPASVVQEIQTDDRQVMGTGNSMRIRTARVLTNGVRLEYLTVKRPWTDEAGRVIGLVGTTRNITEVVEAQAEAAAASEGFRALVEAVSELVIVHQDGCVVYANPGALAVLGRTEADVIGAALSELVRPQDRVLLGRRGAAAVEVGFVRPDERVRLVEITEVGASWCGQPARFTIGRDVSMKRRMQGQLQHADRLAAVGMLAAGVAHEIKNPLTYLLAGLSQLGEEAPPESRTRLSDLADAAERINAIVQGISGLSRPDPPSQGPVDAELAIDRALLLAGPRLRDRAEIVRTRGDIPLVRGSERRLVQVFLNLLVNAALAMAGLEGRGRLEISSAREADGVVFRVRDNGPGVPEAVSRRLFEPFESTRHPAEGSGLGLWISAGIARDFGGSLTLENPGASGACFRLALRSADEAAASTRASAAPAPRPPVAAPSPGVRPRLLVVDDERLITDLLSEGLASAFVVEVRPGVVEAVERLGQEPKLDLILCDLIMPAGGGPRVYDALQALPEPRPVLRFMSGGAATPELRGFLAEHGLLPIEKPFRIAALRRRLLDAVAGTD